MFIKKIKEMQEQINSLTVSVMELNTKLELMQCEEKDDKVDYKQLKKLWVEGKDNDR